MSIEAMSVVPEKLAAGTTWKIQRSYPNYPAGEGWVVTFYFAKQGSAHDFDCTPAGDEHLLTVSATDTAAMGDGYWAYEARAELSGEVYVVETGTVTVTPDFTTGDIADPRSHAQRMLEAIQTVLEGRASSSLLETEINTGATKRLLKYMTHAELMAAHSHYKYQVAMESRRARGKNGGIFAVMKEATR